MIRVQANGCVHYQFESLADQKGLQHAVFTRLGGVSAPPFDSLNVGATVGDSPLAVQANRARVLEALGLSPERVVTAYQVHSARVAPVGVSDGGHVVPGTDGLLSREGVALLLRFADCVPILLFDPAKRAIGLLHAGWKGTSARIVEKGVAQMQERFGSEPGHIVAAIGPSIGPCCYQVQEDFARDVSRAWPQAAAFIHRERNGYRADLWRMNHRQLADAGVRHIELAQLCTACHRDEFYSHRGDSGLTGRFAVVLRLQG